MKALFVITPTQQQQQVTVKTTFMDQHKRKFVTIKNDDNVDRIVYCFRNDETVSGHINIDSSSLKKEIQHGGIVVELIGEVVTMHQMDNSRTRQLQFTHAVQHVAAEGVITNNEFEPESTNVLFFHFEPDSCQCCYESFHGEYTQCRYYIQVKILVLGKNTQPILSRSEFYISCEKDPNVMVPDTEGHVVYNESALSISKSNNKKLTMEVGLGDDLTFVLRLYKILYHMNDIVIGKITFLKNGIRLKRMEILIIRREKVFDENHVEIQSTTQTISKFEIMDGDPPKDQMIPIRLYLSGIHHLTPSYNIEGYYNVSYLLNFCLIDIEDRRLFKQQEIYLYRKEWPSWKS
jgi:vacuolar protein sorting-associated protein 26